MFERQCGPRCSVELKGGRLHWLCRLGEQNVFARVVELPPGVSARDVEDVHPTPDGMTLLTKTGDQYDWDSGTTSPADWSEAVNVLKPVGAR